MTSIQNILLAVATFLFTSCVSMFTDTDDIEIPEIQGLMNFEITEQTGLADDKIKTVRFIVFKDIYNSPKLELNELFDMPEVAPGDEEVSKFKLILELSMRPGGANNKMVVAVLNEPPAIKNALDEIDNYNQLQKMELNLTDFLNASHTTLQDSRTMPMTSVSWTNKVFATPQEAENNPVSMSVSRATARIDLYMRKEAGMDINFAMGTEITLNNTYHSQYLIRHNEGANTFGEIKTVTSGFISKSWSLAESDSKELPVVSAENSGRLLCTFYTPERTSMANGNTDKLILRINMATSEGALRREDIIIDRFQLNGVEKDVDIIGRNNIYKVIATVGSNSITSEIVDWNNCDIGIEL